MDTVVRGNYRVCVYLAYLVAVGFHLRYLLQSMAAVVGPSLVMTGPSEYELRIGRSVRDLSVAARKVSHVEGVTWTLFCASWQRRFSLQQLGTTPYSYIPGY